MTKEATQTMIPHIMEAFDVSEGPAAVIAAIINEEFDKLETVIADATEAAQERINEGEPSAERADMTDLELLTAEEIGMYLSDFTVSEGQGQGSMYTVENGHEYMFGTSDDCDQEAEADYDNLIDDMLKEPDWVAKHVVPSWESGQTRAEFVKEGAEVDSLARHDGNVWEVSHEGTLYQWFRTN